MDNVIELKRPETDETLHRKMERAASAFPVVIVRGEAIQTSQRVPIDTVPPADNISVGDYEDHELLRVVIRPGVTPETARELLLKLAENIRLSGLPLVVNHSYPADDDVPF